MKILHLSDTHGLHLNFTHSIETIVQSQDIDVVVHSGDFSDYAIPEETEFFLRWFKLLPVPHKILVAGNHDTTVDNEHDGCMEEFNFDGIHYLSNELIEINGVKFYGAPHSMSPFGGAFTYYPEDAQTIWKDIEPDADVLITHTPPSNILDDGYGCLALSKKIEQLNIKVHLFGHIHQASGMKEVEGVVYSNAATKMNVVEVCMSEHNQEKETVRERLKNPLPIKVKLDDL